jgi:apolipoprotein N-acyltransferase
VILLPALVGSAYFMALALGSPDYGWLGLITLLPLFQAIRVQRPAAAGFCGGLWGAALFAFSAITGSSAIETSLFSAAYLALVPAIYAYLGARLTARVGFSPYLLALGWIGVEFALRPLGLHFGLLAATQDDGFALRVLGSFAGYVLVAFLVAYFNAALLSALAEVSGACRSARVIRRGASLIRTTFAFDAIVQLREFLRQAQPRGPPALAFATVRRGQ